MRSYVFLENYICVKTPSLDKYIKKNAKSSGVGAMAIKFGELSEGSVFYRPGIFEVATSAKLEATNFYSETCSCVNTSSLLYLSMLFIFECMEYFIVSTSSWSSYLFDWNYPSKQSFSHFAILLIVAFILLTEWSAYFTVN